MTKIRGCLSFFCRFSTGGRFLPFLLGFCLFLSGPLAVGDERQSQAYVEQSGELLCAVAAAVDSYVLSTYALDVLAEAMVQSGASSLPDTPSRDLLALARSAWLTKSLLLAYADSMHLTPTEEEAEALAEEYARGFRERLREPEALPEELKKAGLDEEELVPFFRRQYAEQINERIRVANARALALQAVGDSGPDSERKAIHELSSRFLVLNYDREVSPLAYEWGEQVQLAEIRVAGSFRVSREAIAGRVQTKVGEPLSLEQLSRDVEALYEMGAFADIAVYGVKDEALTVTFDLVEFDPSGLLKLAGDLKAGGHPQSAIGVYRRILAAFPDAPEAASATESASAAYLEIGDRPAASQLRWTRAAYYTQKGQADRAEAQYRKVLDESPDAVQAPYYLSVFLQGQGRHEEAIALARRAVEMAPGDALMRLHLMGSYALGGHADEALKAAAELSKWFPDRAGEIYYEVALGLKESGKADEALAAAFQSTRKAGPPAANFLLGQLLMARGMESQAAEEFEKAFKAKPDDVYFQIESAYGVLKSGHAQKAIELCLAIIQKHPDAPGQAYAVYAIALERNNQADRAVAAAREALKRAALGDISYPEFQPLAQKVAAQ